MLGRTVRRLLLGAATGVFALVSAASLEAQARTNHALIVAVGEYPNLPKRKWLTGPRNDALLVRDYLTTQSPVPFDAGNVTLLADRIDGAAEPTRDEILKALEALAGRAGKDDFVYLQFSGHGFHQTALDPSTETDGLDEIFLPKDTGVWKDRKAGMPNAIIDDEIGAALDAIRARGAFVWVVFDACHSGTATRALEEVTMRNLDPEDVGMPPEVIEEAMAAGTATRGEPVRENALGVTGADGASGDGRGGMVAFFAAQTNETTPEMPLPFNQEGADKLGLFTFSIFQELAANPNVTYRQLGQAVLQSYAAINRTATTPLFEGDLDAPVFGTEIGDFVPQWRIETAGGGLALPAGLLHRLSPGTVLAVLPKPGSTLDEAVGYVEVRGATNSRSRIAPVAFEGVPAIAESAVPDNAYARVVKRAVDFRMRVARPPASEEFSDGVAMVNAALDAIAADDRTPVNIELVEPGQPADIALSVFSQASLPEADFSASDAPAVWFLPASGEAEFGDRQQPPGIIMESGDEAAIVEAMAENLTRIYRATNLARLAAVSDFRPDEIEFDFAVTRANGGGGEEKVARGAVPFGFPDDAFSVQVRNKSDALVDLNLLYVGADYSISWMRTERLQPGAAYPPDGARDTFVRITDSDFGVDKVIAIMTEALPLTPTEDLRFLEQKGVKTRTRGDEPTSIGDMVKAMGFGAATRGGARVGGDKTARGAVMIFPIETRPR